MGLRRLRAHRSGGPQSRVSFKKLLDSIPNLVRRPLVIARRRCELAGQTHLLGTGDAEHPDGFEGGGLRLRCVRAFPVQQLSGLEQLPFANELLDSSQHWAEPRVARPSP